MPRALLCPAFDFCSSFVVVVLRLLVFLDERITFVRQQVMLDEQDIVVRRWLKKKIIILTADSSALIDQ